jgi:ribose 5-phosphate isomerase A
MLEKKLAAEEAVNYIEDGMIIGIGSGSTVSLMMNILSQRIKGGLNVTAVSTSSATTKLATSLGIKISKINEVEWIDLTIDGADEVDENLNGIKGGGGALLYEKIVASMSRKNIWIVDSTKLVKTLGKFPLPVEVVQFGSHYVFKKFDDLGFQPGFRNLENTRFITDNNNYIIDLQMDKIDNPNELDISLKQIAGVVETGLFCNVADIVLVGIGSSVKTIDKKKRVQTH